MSSSSACDSSSSFSSSSYRYVYRIILAEDWEAAKLTGFYSGSALDQRDGYIHLSTSSQVSPTAARYFSKVSNLLCLQYEISSFSDLRWDSVKERNGEYFPHLYNQSLPVETLVKCIQLTLDDTGIPVVPELPM
jgi:uncharacterized protein (DUF952 family)